MERLKIEYVDINSIKPYKNNAKLHPKEQIEQIKTSIEMFGMDDTIDGKPYSEIVEIAREYIKQQGGFEKFAEWGLY